MEVINSSNKDPINIGRCHYPAGTLRLTGHSVHTNDDLLDIHTYTLEADPEPNNFKKIRYEVIRSLGDFWEKGEIIEQVFEGWLRPEGATAIKGISLELGMKYLKEIKE